MVRIIECGCCSAYHRVGFHGDCRNDQERIPCPDIAAQRFGFPVIEVFEDEDGNEDGSCELIKDTPAEHNRVASETADDPNNFDEWGRAIESEVTR